MNAFHDQPEALERLYREAPDRFHEAYDTLQRQEPDALLVRAWAARLAYEPGRLVPPDQAHRLREIGLVILLGLLAGTVAKLPAFIGGLDPEYFYPRHIGFILFPALAAYALLRQAALPRITWGLAGAFAAALLFVNLLPQIEGSATLTLTWIHLPLVLWLLVGLAFTGDAYRDHERWMHYLRLNGEVLVYTAILLLAGMLLTGLTIGLFSMIDLNIEEWYAEYVGVYGAAAAPLVGAYLALHREQAGQRLAPIVARIFSPLALITLIAYLSTMVIQRQSPFTDRDFLIVFNGMLLGVLALTIFTISERPDAETKTFSDLVCLVLVFMALLIDLVALSAIVFRLASFGLTPNRVAVLGANLLIFIHLGDILIGYGRFLREQATVAAVERRVTRFLPVYAAWVLFVAVALPFLFGFA